MVANIAMAHTTRYRHTMVGVQLVARFFLSIPILQNSASGRAMFLLTCSILFIAVSSISVPVSLRRESADCALPMRSEVVPEPALDDALAGLEDGLAKV